MFYKETKHEMKVIHKMDISCICGKFVKTIFICIVNVLHNDADIGTQTITMFVSTVTYLIWNYKTLYKQ